MSKISAGLLIYRLQGPQVEVLLVHPGGPFFKKKDDGVWSIPKGEVLPDEELLAAATREFIEELGVIPSAEVIELGAIKQKGGKTVHAWAAKGSWDASQFVSNTFSMEWPPGSGRQMEFPEVDRAEFFDLEIARSKINPAQIAFLERLCQHLESDSGLNGRRMDE